MRRAFQRWVLAGVVCLAPASGAWGQQTEGAPPLSAGAARDSAEALYWQAYDAYQSGNPDLVRLAVRLWKRAVEFLRQTGDTRYLETVLRSISSAYDFVDEPDSARAYLDRAARVGEIVARASLSERPRGAIVSAAAVVSRFGGVTSETLRSGIGADVQFRYGLPLGFGLGVGGVIESHGITGRTTLSGGLLQEIRPRYTMRALYAEARWTWATGTRLLPSVEARGGRAWEGVNTSGARFSANGALLGVGAGVRWRIHPQLAVVVGGRWQTIAFGDFSFSGEAAIDNCLLPLRESGAPLPAGLAQCAGLREYAQLTSCEGAFTSGTGCRPTTLHPRSARRDSWVGLWLGFDVDLGTSR